MSEGFLTPEKHRVEEKHVINQFLKRASNNIKELKSFITLTEISLKAYKRISRKWMYASSFRKRVTR